MTALTALASMPAVIILIVLVTAVALRQCEGRGESQTQQSNDAGSHPRIKKHEGLL
jgi:hypothetical protein